MSPNTKPSITGWYKNLWRYGPTKASVCAPLSSISNFDSESSDVDLKPKGWWFSIGNDWSEWWSSEMEDKKRVAYRAQLFVPKGQLIVIQTVKDVMGITERYGEKTRWGTFLDWGKLRADHPDKKGILMRVRPYRIEGAEWLSGWDVLSGAVWNTDGIRLGPIERT